MRTWWQKKYPEDEAKAEAIANAMDSTIWTTLTGLMGQPLSDAGTTYDGGNGNVDIYLVDVARSVAIDHAQPGCEITPAYINLARGASMSIVAHEFMHVLQWGYDMQTGCMYRQGGDYNWLAEATAQWAMDFVYPSVNQEQQMAPVYMGDPDGPLDTANDAHEYGAYLFFQYVTKLYDTGQIVRTVWNNTAQHGSLGAVEQALPGGFEERWAPFAACLWNAPPSGCFAQWDQLADSVEATVLTEDVDMGAATISRTLELSVSVEHMAASYRRFSFTDDSIAAVTFENTLAGVPHAGVQALAKIDGQWQGPLDWMDRATASFCLGIEGQEIEELVIIFSNNDWVTGSSIQPADPPELTVSTVCPATVTLAWDADIADVQIQLWVLPQAASNADEAQGQDGQPGYATVDNRACDVPFRAEQSEVIEAVTEDAQYVAARYWGYCIRDPDNWPAPPSSVPVTITIQYPDGTVETETGDLAGFGFASFGPYDFGP